MQLQNQKSQKRQNSGNFEISGPSAKRQKTWSEQLNVYESDEDKLKLYFGKLQQNIVEYHTNGEIRVQYQSGPILRIVDIKGLKFDRFLVFLRNVEACNSIDELFEGD